MSFNAWWFGDVEAIKRMCRPGDNSQANDGFPFLCQRGHLEAAQWIHGLHGVDLHACMPSAFKKACNSGHLQVALWLYGLGGVDIHADHDLVFCSTAFYGHLHVMKWLFGLGGVDIHASRDVAIKSAANWSGGRPVAQWLISLDPAYPWPPESMAYLKTWSLDRDAWMRSCLSRRA